MITPQEIEEISFRKSVRGFNCDDVYDFLDRVKIDYENLIRENETLKERINLYNEQISKYTNIEDTLKETLITAQTAADDTISAANKNAKIIIERGKLEAEKKINEANERVINIRKEHDILLSEFKIFKNKFTSLLENELKNIEEMYSDIDPSLLSSYEYRTAMESYENKNFESEEKDSDISDSECNVDEEAQG